MDPNNTNTEPQLDTAEQPATSNQSAVSPVSPTTTPQAPVEPTMPNPATQPDVSEQNDPPTSIPQPTIQTEPVSSPAPIVQGSNIPTPQQPPQPQISADSKLPKSVRTTGLVSIILGAILLPVALLLAWLIDMSALINLVFVVVYLVFGIRLRGKDISVAQALLGLKILMITIIINMIAGLLSGGSGVGFLPLLVLIFSTKAFNQLFEAGLTTSKVPLTAKAK